MRLRGPCVEALAFVVLGFGAPVSAQQVCGGIAGLPCPPGQFCELAPGECCCDFSGVCAEVPLACPAVCDPVCGCDGTTYQNRCEAAKAGVSVDRVGPCSPVDPSITLGFSYDHHLFWDPLPHATAYNVYVADSDVRPPRYRCLYFAVPNWVLLVANPTPGDLLMLRVSALMHYEESPLGAGGECGMDAPAEPCTCTLPADGGPCDGAIPRWYHDYIAGGCEKFIWGGCGGNANNFATEAECAEACLDPCLLPADDGPCEAYSPRWYHNVLSGRCERFVWGGCGGNANNFATEAECRDACAAPAD